VALFNFFRRFFKKSEPESIDMVLIGIGNIGEKYAGTRHNIGFDVADALEKRLTNSRIRTFRSARVIIGTLPSGKRIAVAKPQTFVNRSGEAAKELLEHYAVPAEKCLVIVDDFHLNIGALRVRRDGSDGGHNGLKSLISSIGQNFPRVRMGIGPRTAGISIIDFVLGTFGSDELEKKDAMVLKGVESVISFAEKGIDTTMSIFNKS
jgi:PTH1 family peptidyl-tRNA hydrolase